MNESKTKTMPRWMRSKYQLKKEIKRRFAENMTAEYKKILIEQEVKIIFGDSKIHKPMGILKCTNLKSR